MNQQVVDKDGKQGKHGKDIDPSGGKQATEHKAASESKPTVEQQPPEKELENQLKANPHDLDAKVDVGSDESMDASDPSAAAQPGQNDEPVPSSGFPEDASDDDGMPRP